MNHATEEELFAYRDGEAKGREAVVCLKATGTSSVAELALYEDFGAAQTFDCADFGLPTTYPSGRAGIGDVIAGMLDVCLSLREGMIVLRVPDAEHVVADRAMPAKYQIKHLLSVDYQAHRPADSNIIPRRLITPHNKGRDAASR